MGIQHQTILRQIIRHILSENFQSHTSEPIAGEYVENVNPQCKHFGSKGEVVDVSSLPDDAGTTVKYSVINNGDNFSPGDVLEKTLDQLTSLQLQRDRKYHQ